MRTVKASFRTLLEIPTIEDDFVVLIFLIKSASNFLSILISLSSALLLAQKRTMVCCSLVPSQFPYLRSND